MRITGQVTRNVDERRETDGVPVSELCIGTQTDGDADAERQLKEHRRNCLRDVLQGKGV